MAYWSKDKLKANLEKKFNKKGFAICKKNRDGVYNKICFGKNIDYDYWIDKIKSGIVIFDSGMYEGNNRLYSTWRANEKFWNELIIDEY